MHSLHALHVGARGILVGFPHRGLLFGNAERGLHIGEPPLDHGLEVLLAHHHACAHAAHHAGAHHPPAHHPLATLAHHLAVLAHHAATRPWFIRLGKCR
jgi:hypothetical protein